MTDSYNSSYNSPGGLTTEQIAAGTADTPDTGELHTRTQSQAGFDAPAQTRRDSLAGTDNGVDNAANADAVDLDAANVDDAADADTADVAPATNADTAANAVDGAEEGRAHLLADDELQIVVVRWKEIQAQFVDDPRSAVQDADALVADLMQRLARMFADERGQLESRWASGEAVSTEDLRQGLRRYRSFFERLLAA